MRLFVGLHQPSDAKHFDACMVSINRLRNRKSPFVVHDWIMDSGAFTTILQHGGYPFPPEEYAAHIEKWKNCGHMLAAVAQDFMCEPQMLALTGGSVTDHQRWTIERYDGLSAMARKSHIMPVLQGYLPNDYIRHIRMYGDRLLQRAWVGVGSICKRNGDPSAIRAVLWSIKRERPDLRLHGFGLKQTALASPLVRDLLYSADSMAWSYAARKQGRNSNDWREAQRWATGDDGGLFA